MPLRKPPLSDVHAAADASFTDFGGWEMPVEFDSIRTEHESVRETAGIFDVSHMGELEVTGPDATELMDRLTTNDVAGTTPGRAQYAAITNDDGVILDDTMLYHLPEDDDADYLFVPNAGKDEVTAERWRRHRDEWGLDATVENRTDDYAMVAVQGPDAPELVAAETDEPIDEEIGRFRGRYATVAGVRCWVARTGYTGEDGFELILPAEEAETVWSALDVQRCGLGARDTLRLEAGLLLAGQDFHPEENPRTPYEAGIGFTVDLDTEFVGRDALARQHEAGVEEKLVGFVMTERGIPRHGYPIETPDGDEIGTVTSGTMSPTLGEAIGLGYVPVEHADAGTELVVSIRERPRRARVESLPFLEADE